MMMRQTNRSKALLILHLVQVAISQRFIEAERMSNWKLQLQMCSTLYVAIFRSIWSFTLCKVCIRIPANRATSTRNSSRCAPEIHGRIPCGERQRKVLGWIVHRHNHRASAYEKYKDTCRTDKRKGDDREAAFGVGLVHACVHASMRPFKSLAVYHMKQVTSTRMYQQLDKREVSVTPLI